MSSEIRNLFHSGGAVTVAVDGSIQQTEGKLEELLPSDSKRTEDCKDLYISVMLFGWKLRRAA